MAEPYFRMRETGGPYRGLFGTQPNSIYYSTDWLAVVKRFLGECGEEFMGRYLKRHEETMDARP